MKFAIAITVCMLLVLAYGNYRMEQRLDDYNAMLRNVNFNIEQAVYDHCVEAHPELRERMGITVLTIVQTDSPDSILMRETVLDTMWAVASDTLWVIP